MQTGWLGMLGVLLAALWIPQSSWAGCSGPSVALPGDNKVSPHEVVKVIGAGFAEDLPCCDSGAEACEQEKADSNVVPYRDMTIGLKDRGTGDEKIVGRGIDAGMRGRFRTSFRIPGRVEPGVYRVRINVPDQGTYGTGRLRVRSP